MPTVTGSRIQLCSHTISSPFSVTVGRKPISALFGAAENVRLAAWRDDSAPASAMSRRDRI